MITGDDVSETECLKHQLSREFEMKNLGKLRYFLGMEVMRSKQGISVSQRKYVLELLKETGMLGCKPIDTPMDPNTKLSDSSMQSLVDKGRYQRLLVNSFIWHTQDQI